MVGQAKLSHSPLNSLASIRGTGVSLGHFLLAWTSLCPPCCPLAVVTLLPALLLVLSPTTTTAGRVTCHTRRLHDVVSGYINSQPQLNDLAIIQDWLHH